MKENLSRVTTREFFDRMARKALAQHFKTEAIQALEQDGARGRHLVLHLYRPCAACAERNPTCRSCKGTGTNGLIGSYGFTYVGGGKFHYRTQEFVPLGNSDPVVQVSMTDRTWWDIMLQRLGAMAAYKAGRLGFQSSDSKTFYHVTFLMKLFEMLRIELEGML